MSSHDQQPDELAHDVPNHSARLVDLVSKLAAVFLACEDRYRALAQLTSRTTMVDLAGGDTRGLNEQRNALEAEIIGLMDRCDDLAVKVNAAHYDARQAWQRGVEAAPAAEILEAVYKYLDEGFKTPLPELLSIHSPVVN